MFIVACIYAFGVRGNFLENDFWIPPPPPLLSILYMNIFLIYSKLVWIIGHVAAALAPLKPLKRPCSKESCKVAGTTLFYFENIAQWYMFKSGSFRAVFSNRPCEWLNSSAKFDFSYNRLHFNFASPYLVFNFQSFIVAPCQFNFNSKVTRDSVRLVTSVKPV